MKIPFKISDIPFEKKNTKKIMIFTYLLLELRAENIRVREAKKVEIRMGSTITPKIIRGSVENCPVKMNLKISRRMPGTKVKSSR